MDLYRSVDLFEKKEADHLVGEGHRREGEGVSLEMMGDPFRSSNHEGMRGFRMQEGGKGL